MIFSPTDRRPGERLSVDLFAQLADDVRQLTQPWTRQVWRERRTSWWDRNRNRKVRHRRWATTVHYPGLLDQLRACVHPGDSAPRVSRRTVPGSRPALAVDPSDRLALIYVGIAWWVARTGARPPPAADLRTQTDGVGGFYTIVRPADDWWVGALRALVGAAASMEVEQAERLVADVRRWWTWAAKQAGWNPQELLDERSG